MRIGNWKAQGIFEQIVSLAQEQSNYIMDKVVIVAKQKCPILKDLSQERPDGWAHAEVSFTPKTGHNKGTLVKFSTDKRWTGRRQGDLQQTIRRVNNAYNPGNVRVYAGNFKIYYAYMVEKGTIKTPAQPFLRPAFNQIKQTAIADIQRGLNEGMPFITA